MGKSSFDVLGVLEQQFKQISSLNLKRLTAELNIARIVPHLRRYSLILSEQTQEILVLRGEMAVGFLPSELMSGKLQVTPGADGEKVNKADEPDFIGKTDNAGYVGLEPSRLDGENIITFNILSGTLEK